MYKTSLFLLTARSFLGRLERIHLGFFTLQFDFYMSGKIADSPQPLSIRSRVGATDFADGTFDDSLTALTVLGNDLT